MAVICEVCQRPVEEIAIRDCARCKRYVAICWSCSDGKASGTVQVEHKLCGDDSR